MIGTFLISIDEQRLFYASRHLRQHGLSFEHIRGCVGRDIPSWLARDFAGSSALTDGEVGCYAAHLKVAQAIVARRLSHALVVEDDVLICVPDLEARISKAVRAAPADWDLIQLGGVFVKGAMVEVDTLGFMSHLVRYRRMPMNTAAYVLSNAGARKLLNAGPRPYAIDVDISYPWQRDINVYGVFPSLVAQAAGTSIIGERPKTSRAPFLGRIRNDLHFMRKVGLGRFLHALFLDTRNSYRRRTGSPLDVTFNVIMGNEAPNHGEDPDPGPDHGVSESPGVHYLH